MRSRRRSSGASYLGYAYPTAAKTWKRFRHRLRDLGYVEGKNLVIESRSAESGFERLPELAAELVGQKVDVIAAFGNRTIMALKQGTPTIPIVMVSSGDPAGRGWCVVWRPGGNVTGLASLAEGLSAKWLELLRQTVSGMARVGVLMEPAGTARATFLREIKTVWGSKPASLSLGVEARGRDEIERALISAANQPPPSALRRSSPWDFHHWCRMVMSVPTEKWRTPMSRKYFA
jgi:putative ABC transport system substrate-binding protein